MPDLKEITEIIFDGIKPTDHTDHTDHTGSQIILGDGKYYLTAIMSPSEELFGITIHSEGKQAGEIMLVNQSDCTILFRNTESLNKLITILESLKQRLNV